MGLLLRWGCAFLLLAATFNPTEWNYIHWARQNYAKELPMTVLLGLLLAIGYIVYLRATLRSIGGLGMILVLAVVCALLWVLYDYGLFELGNPHVNTWIGLMALSSVLGVGLGWSIVRRMLTGQLDTDDVDS